MRTCPELYGRASPGQGVRRQESDGPSPAHTTVRALGRCRQARRSSGLRIDRDLSEVAGVVQRWQDARSPFTGEADILAVPCNGRAQRAFFAQLARDAGFTLAGSTLIRPQRRGLRRDHARRPEPMRDARSARQGRHLTTIVCIRNGVRVWGGRGVPEWPFWSSLRVVAGLAPADARQPLGRGEAGGAWHPVDAAGWLVTGPDPWHPATGLKPEEATPTPWVPWRSRTSVEAGAGQALGQGWRTILPGMPPAAFALNASAARASGYTAPTWGRRCPSSTRRASSIS